jgi:hypothetical protein
VSGFTEAVSDRESTALVSAATLSLVVSRGATTGRGSQTFGSGGGASAGALSRATATARGESPHPMAVHVMTRRIPSG